MMSDVDESHYQHEAELMMRRRVMLLQMTMLLFMLLNMTMLLFQTLWMILLKISMEGWHQHHVTSEPIDMVLATLDRKQASQKAKKAGHGTRDARKSRKQKTSEGTRRAKN